MPSNKYHSHQTKLDNGSYFTMTHRHLEDSGYGHQHVVSVMSIKGTHSFEHSIHGMIRTEPARTWEQDSDVDADTG